MGAELDLDARRWPQAREGFRLGAELAESLGALSVRLNANYGRGVVALAQGEPEQAGKMFVALRSLAVESGSRYGQLLARLGEGQLALTVDRPQAAQRSAREALALAQALEHREYHAAARELLSDAMRVEPTAEVTKKAPVRASRHTR